MKKYLYGATALLLLAGTASCGSSKKAAGTPAPVGMTEEVVPLSGPQYRSDAEYFRAVQNGVSTDRSTAQKIAMQNCRQELAANIQAELQVVIENYVKEQNTGVAAENKSQYQEMAYTTVKQRLNDVQIVEEKIYRQEDGSYRFYVCLQMPKSAIETAVEAAIAKDAKLNLEFDREQFKKVFEERMAAFSKQ
ncbi:MAG: hypothetical protein K2K30_00105 [Alistipes sp.]|nr:hypothetical protein [Alistipes sp.]